MVRYGIVLLSLLAAFAYADELSEACTNITKEFFLPFEHVKKCFQEDYYLSESMIDQIIRNLEIIGDIYPYVDINIAPPQSDDKEFPTINFTEKFEELKSTLRNSDRQISRVFPPLAQFVNQFRDSHFAFSLLKSDMNIFSQVYYILPFEWYPVPTEEGIGIIIAPNDFTPKILPQYSQMIASMAENGVLVKSVNGASPVDFFADFFEQYDNMRFFQAQLTYTRVVTSQGGVHVLQYPTDKAFSIHTIVYNDEDSSSFQFSPLFLNIANPPQSGRDGVSFPVIHPLPLVPSFSLKDEEEVVEALKTFKYKKHSGRNLAEHTMLPCNLDSETGMNYILISTFMYQGTDAILQYLQELAECYELFSGNDKPITIILPVNNGGNVGLMQATQAALLGETDPSLFLSFRETEATKSVFVDGYSLYPAYGTEMANMSNKCEMNEKQFLEDVWNNPITDTYESGQKHIRTKKNVLFSGELMKMVFQFTEGRKLRNPTDIIIATDGYCASSCAFFCYLAKRSGSAVLTAYGASAPGDEYPVAGQCTATVINVESYFKDVANNSLYGLSFLTTVSEAYSSMDEENDIIPLEFSTTRVDYHLQFFQTAIPQSLNVGGILESANSVHEVLKISCNPNNKNLINVTDCDIDDVNAEIVGNICGDDGTWNASSCKILRCKPMYTLDRENNKCVPTVCDARSILFHSSSSDSSSSESSSNKKESSSNTQSSVSSTEDLSASVAVTTSPVYGIIAIIAAIIAVLSH